MQQDMDQHSYNRFAQRTHIQIHTHSRTHGHMHTHTLQPGATQTNTHSLLRCIYVQKMASRVDYFLVKFHLFVYYIRVIYRYNIERPPLSGHAHTQRQKHSKHTHTQSNTPGPRCSHTAEKTPSQSQRARAHANVRKYAADVRVWLWSGGWRAGRFVVYVYICSLRAF